MRPAPRLPPGHRRTAHPPHACTGCTAPPALGHAASRCARCALAPPRAAVAADGSARRRHSIRLCRAGLQLAAVRGAMPDASALPFFPFVVSFFAPFWLPHRRNSYLGCCSAPHPSNMTCFLFGVPLFARNKSRTKAPPQAAAPPRSGSSHFHLKTLQKFRHQYPAAIATSLPCCSAPALPKKTKIRRHHTLSHACARTPRHA